MDKNAEVKIGVVFGVLRDREKKNNLATIRLMRQELPEERMTAIAEKLEAVLRR
ncbi:MAG: hypothetical protein AAGA60_18805 [Cyanobacteria bacterium P01_E01_bin.42]